MTPRMSPKDAPVHTGGVYRCCLDDLPDRIPDGPVEAGWILACPHCGGGLEWTGEQWQAAWINRNEVLSQFMQQAEEAPTYRQAEEARQAEHHEPDPRGDA